MPIRKTVASPVPQEELARIKAYLAPQYGSQLWTGGSDLDQPAAAAGAPGPGEGVRHFSQQHDAVLLIRVPSDEPDLVNDVEYAVEYISPGDLKRADQCLLIGERKIHAVSTEPFRQLMRERMAMDRRIGAVLQQQVAEPGEYTLYRHGEDPRRLVRLGVRIDKQYVRDLDESDQEMMAECLGPVLDTPQFDTVHAVYLLGAQDEVRLDPDLFLQEIGNRWRDEDRRREREHQEKVEADRRNRIRRVERERVLRELGRRFGAAAPSGSSAVQGSRGVGSQAGVFATRSGASLPPGGATAPGSHGAPSAPIAGAASEAADGDPPLEQERVRPHETGASGGGRRQDVDAALSMHDEAAVHAGAMQPPQELQGPRVLRAPLRKPEPAGAWEADALEAAGEMLEALSGGHGHGDDPGSKASGVPGGGSAGAAAIAGSSGRDSPSATPRAVQELERVLAGVGYAVSSQPDVPGRRVDLAAERPDGYPQRVVARLEERLTPEVARDALADARELGVDIAFVVAEGADEDARKALVATKVKWVTPKDVKTLSL